MFGLITYDWQNKEAVVFFFDITNLTCRLMYKLNLNGFNNNNNTNTTNNNNNNSNNNNNNNNIYNIYVHTIYLRYKTNGLA